MGWSRYWLDGYAALRLLICVNLVTNDVTNDLCMYRKICAKVLSGALHIGGCE